MTHPFLLELNTRCWLHELSERCGRPINLSRIPEEIVGQWIRMGVTHLWLMGVWTTGPKCQAQALTNGYLQEAYNRALPGWQKEDVAGSPYAIESYSVPASLGGLTGLHSFRCQLQRHGLKLILDFIPNHVGLDHPWINQRSELFVQSAASHASAFASESGHGTCWIAHGRDPHFTPWSDTAQLDYRRADVHEAMTTELLRLADLCDGLRCDMAMLLLKDVFAKTWEEFPVLESETGLARREFWEFSVGRVKRAHPGFLLFAEVYWDMEERLQELGFDYTYDKTLTDALLRGQGSDAVRHVHSKTPEFVHRSAHFLENHDERRVASSLSFDAHRAAAMVTWALPGMRFLYDGQTRGARVHTPVQLRRRLPEPVDARIRDMYANLTEALRTAGVGEGQGLVLQTQRAWQDNPTAENILTIQWTNTGHPPILVVVNLSDHQSQCRVPIMVESAAPAWCLMDLLGDERWERSAADLRDPGLFLDLAPHAVQLFRLEPSRA